MCARIRKRARWGLVDQQAASSHHLRRALGAARNRQGRSSPPRAHSFRRTGGNRARLCSALARLLPAGSDVAHLRSRRASPRPWTCCAPSRAVRDPGRRCLRSGYAGWAPGQLEGEIRANGWLNCAADEELLFGAEIAHEMAARHGQARHRHLDVVERRRNTPEDQLDQKRAMRFCASSAESGAPK